MGGNGMRQEVIRSAIGYYLKPYWGLYLGYGWNPSFNDFRNENRVYQESLFDQHFGDLRLIWNAALLWLFFHVFVLVYEEPTLKQTFGAQYEDFRANVPRWVPRLTPWRVP